MAEVASWLPKWKITEIMNVIDILPEYYWFYKQNGHSEINYVILFFDNQPIRYIVCEFFCGFGVFDKLPYRTVGADFEFLFFFIIFFCDFEICEAILERFLNIFQYQ